MEGERGAVTEECPEASGDVAESNAGGRRDPLREGWKSGTVILDPEFEGVWVWLGDDADVDGAGGGFHSVADGVLDQRLE